MQPAFLADNGGGGASVDYSISQMIYASPLLQNVGPSGSYATQHFSPGHSLMDGLCSSMPPQPTHLPTRHQWAQATDGYGAVDIGNQVPNTVAPTAVAHASYGTQQRYNCNPFSSGNHVMMAQQQPQPSQYYQLVPRQPISNNAATPPPQAIGGQGYHGGGNSNPTMQNAQLLIPCDPSEINWPQQWQQYNHQWYYNNDSPSGP